MPPKLSRLLAVDPSLTCSGWALFRLKDQKLLAVGKLKSVSRLRTAGSKAAWPERMRDLQLKIQTCLEMLELSSDDFLVCEAATTMRDPRAALLVEQVRTIFETMARTRQVEVPGRLNPRTVQHEIMGLRGRQLSRLSVKDAAVRIAYDLFGKELRELELADDMSGLRRHQDIVDALLVGASAIARIEHAGRSGQETFAMFEERRMRSSNSIRRDWAKLMRGGTAA